MLRTIVAVLLIVCAGCRPPVPPPKPAGLPLEGVKLKLIVVDDEAIAKSIGRLKTEWKAGSGSELTIFEMSSAEVLTASSLDGDAIIYPASLIGTLVEHKLLTPVPKSVLEDEKFAWSQVFQLLQEHESTWGETVYALPLGSRRDAQSRRCSGASLTVSRTTA